MKKTGDRQRFQLVQDDSSHWYVIPCSKAKEFFRWIETEEYTVPDWAERVNGGPGMVSFVDYWIDK